MGKLHGTLAKAGKVRKQTPKVEKQVRRHKIPKGRAYKRILFNRRYQFYANKKNFRFPNLASTKQGKEGAQEQQGGAQQKRKTPNWHAGRKELIEEERKKLALQRKQRRERDQKNKR